MLLAAIGEQFKPVLAPGDDVSGLSVSTRDRDDVIQIWTERADLHEKSGVVTKVNELLPQIRFPTVFYKGKIKEQL